MFLKCIQNSIFYLGLVTILLSQSDYPIPPVIALHKLDDSCDIASLNKLVILLNSGEFYFESDKGSRKDCYIAGRVDFSGHPHNMSYDKAIKKERLDEYLNIIPIIPIRDNSIKDIFDIEQRNRKKIFISIKEYKKISPGYSFIYLDTEKGYMVDDKNANMKIMVVDGKIKISDIKIVNQNLDIIADCFNDKGVRSGTTDIKVQNKLDTSIKVQIRAKCDCNYNSMQELECGYNYEFDNYVHQNNNYILENLYEDQDDTIIIQGKNWFQLEVRAKKGKQWTEYESFDYNRDIVIDEDFINRNSINRGTTLAFGSEWGRGEKQVRYIEDRPFVKGKFKTQNGIKNIKINAKPDDIRHLMVNGNPAKINENNIIVSARPVLVILDLNKTSQKDNKKIDGEALSAYKKIYRQREINGEPIHLYKFLTLRIPSKAERFEQNLIRSFNTTISTDKLDYLKLEESIPNYSQLDYSNITKDSFLAWDEFWDNHEDKIKRTNEEKDDFNPNTQQNYERYKESRGTKAWLYNNVWTYEEILHIDELEKDYGNNNTVLEKADEEKYLFRLDDLDVIENKGMYSKIYYITHAKPSKCDKCEREALSGIKIERKSIYDW